HADRNIDPEDGLPFPPLHDRAADEWAEGDTEAGDATPDADRERPQPRCDRTGEEGQRERQECGTADSLDRAGCDELAGRAAEPGGDRREGEDRDAGGDG